MTLKPFGGRHRWRVVLALLAGAILFAGVAFWRAQQAIRLAADEVASAQSVRFTRRPLQMRTSAEVFAAPAAFRDVAWFEGHFYVAGRTGVWQFDGEGRLTRTWQAGRDLPPSSFVALAATPLKSDQQPKLYVASEREGLLSFDGQTWQQMRPERPAWRKLRCLLPAAGGTLLLGTEGGVIAFDGEQFEPWHQRLPQGPVTALAGQADDLWVGTARDGLWHNRGGQVTQVSVLPERQVLALTARDGRAWVGTAAGVSEVRGNQRERDLSVGGLPVVLHAEASGLWVGTAEQALVQLTGGDRPVLSTPATVSSSPHALRVLNGAIFAVVDSAVLQRVAGGWRSVLTAPAASLADANITALALDEARNLWVGYFDRGAELIRPNGERLARLEDEHVFCVNRIDASGRTGDVALATANGLVLADRTGRIRAVRTRKDGLLSDHVTAAVWTGTTLVAGTGAGVTLFSPGGTQALYAFHGLVNNSVYALGVRADKLVVGTLGGLTELVQGKVVRSLTMANSGLPANWITAVAPQGECWWLGTYGGGVVRWEEGVIHRAEQPRNIVVNPGALLVAEGSVLAGTLEHGLLRYDAQRERWESWDVGLPSSNVTALAADSGYVYIGTDNGLARLRRGEAR